MENPLETGKKDRKAPGIANVAGLATLGPGGSTRQVPLRDFRTRGVKALGEDDGQDLIVLPGRQGPLCFLVAVLPGDLEAEGGNCSGPRPGPTSGPGRTWPGNWGSIP